MKRTEHQEEWVKFVRHYCKEGFIDVWCGDCADNPNNKEKRNFNLNSNETYFRLNGVGNWEKRIFFKESPIGMLNIGSDWNTANEIWDYCKR